MVKVDDRRKLKWCLIHYDLRELGCKWASKHLKITPRRFQQLYPDYKATGRIPDIELDVGSPKKNPKPQTNGKIEKWHDLYANHRSRFGTLSELVDWYNDERVHGSLNLRRAETPSDAFIREMKLEVWLSLAAKGLMVKS